MPNPTASAVHVNRPLTNISIAYMQDAAGFVADKVFPNIPVMKQADRYFRYDRSDFWRNQYQKRAPGTESAGSGWKIDSTPTYFANVWGLHKDVDDQIRANADSPLNMDRDATLWLSQQGLISREVTWAASYFTTSVWTGIDGTNGDITGVASSPSTNQVLQWNDAASNPISDVKAQSDNIHLLNGLRPNKLVLGRQVWTQLSEHPDLIDRIKYTSGNNNPAIVSRQAAAALFELDEISIMDGIQATSAENPTFETSMTTAFIAGKKALLVYAAPQPSILQPSGGYTFSWTGYLPGQGNMGQVISSFRMQHLKADRVEGEMAYDQKLVAATCGVFFTSIIA
ncbi:hypothetical protein EN781_00160 [Mesorhizobium sp. M4A.F.Ca.ET.090.04.2.1]|uniref:major capsid protein n=1 Tax=Mesorhizobium sp. M4A.F.Ca.ET.090.04.2.1 TaxID=2496663 RepID=UPI000FCC8059|nr:major capsid protein [Mesorhizobium sp. M4A.F.Ca.ET.090.04.2.1]RVC47585.1 hypothetical protein EN781_00160 [Mesorhizobium sp. M4A.F.Ca.ET.090.04.2.1]